MVSMKRVFKLIIKELHLLKSDKRALFMAILLPPLIMAAFSSMALMSGTTEGSTIDVAIVNYDGIAYGYTFPNGTTVQLTNNAWTLKLISTMENSSLTNIKYIYNISDDSYGMLYAREHLAHKRIDAIISIPSEFSESIEFEFPAILEAIPDGSDIQESSFAYIRIDNSTSLTAWDALLTRFEVWMGDEPGPRDAYDYAADVERCKGYGWTMPARTGATAVEISNMVYRAGGVTLWQGNYAYERNLIVDAASVSFSDPAHFQISQGVTNYAAATISGGELAGSRRGFLLNVTTASDPFADNSQAVLRVANDLAAITWKTGY